MLNTQIPHADNWRKFDIVELDATKILNSLLMDKARV